MISKPRILGTVRFGRVTELFANAPQILVGADEEAVALFLAGKIGFLEIAELIESVLERHDSITQPDVPAILEASSWARRTAQELYETTYQRKF